MVTLTASQYQDLLDLLKGLKNPNSKALAEEVPPDVAANHLDYLAVQEMMGRLGGPNDPGNHFALAAERTEISGTPYSTITVFGAPPQAVKLAVFTVRGAPTETAGQVGLSRPAGGGLSDVDFELKNVTNDQPIIRLEIQRADGYPIGLGPRLPKI